MYSCIQWCILSFCTILDSSRNARIRPYSQARHKNAKALSDPIYNCRKTRSHTHTHIRMPLWFEGFIGASQSHQAGREEGAATLFQERRHLLAASSVSPTRGTTQSTRYSVLLGLLVQKYKYWHLKSAAPHFTCFTSTKLQILTSEEH